MRENNIDIALEEARREEVIKEEARLEKREFLLNKNVSADSVEKIVLSINEINLKDSQEELKNPSFVRKPIKLIIDSFGGSIYCGSLLVNTIENSDTPVYGYCLSKAMSMGFMIFVVCHKRFASPNATLMYHDAGTTLGGTVTGIQHSVNQTKRMIKRFDSLVTSYTNIKQSRLDRVKREQRNWYIFGDDAVELGLVDELLESKREKHRKKLVDNS